MPRVGFGPAVRHPRNFPNGRRDSIQPLAPCPSIRREKLGRSENFRLDAALRTHAMRVGGGISSPIARHSNALLAPAHSIQRLKNDVSDRHKNHHPWRIENVREYCHHNEDHGHHAEFGSRSPITAVLQSKCLRRTARYRSLTPSAVAADKELCSQRSAQRRATAAPPLLHHARVAPPKLISAQISS